MLVWGESIKMSDYPRRIVCLTEETTETLYLLGEQDRIVGVSGYTARPPEARLKPKVSAFTSAKVDKIVELAPDLVLAFSDLQAEIVRQLLTRGLTVFAFNQRSVTEILEMVETLARIIGKPEKGTILVKQLRSGLDDIAKSAQRFPFRPRVFFEEWNEPLISGIEWVEELVEIAGGQPVFPELRKKSAAKDRMVDPAVVAARNPEVVIASWCGRKVTKKCIYERAGWNRVSAIGEKRVYEVKSTYILQPGPAALTEGVRQLHAIIAKVVHCPLEATLVPVAPLDAAL